MVSASNPIETPDSIRAKVTKVIDHFATIQDESDSKLSAFVTGMLTIAAVLKKTPAEDLPTRIAMIFDAIADDATARGWAMEISKPS